LGGVDFEAIGQEPGWMLTIRDGDRIAFEYDYGTRSVVAPAPVAERDTFGRTVYRAQIEAHDLTVTVSPEACADIMSGERYESTVIIRLDGDTYRGCGRSLR
jgi:putative lipoprotein